MIEAERCGGDKNPEPFFYFLGTYWAFDQPWEAPTSLAQSHSISLDGHTGAAVALLSCTLTSRENG